MKLLMMIALMALPSPFTYGYLDTDTALYSDAQCNHIVTTLPATYFVILLGEEDGVYRVSYKDITGYVLTIEPVDYEPVTKYAASAFTVSNDGYPAKLRSTPDDNAEVMTEIPPDKTGYYYGDVQGKAIIQQVGAKWRYVSYDDGYKTWYGYVYSSQVSVTDILPNVIEKVEPPKNEGEELGSSPNVGTDILLIACLCVPAVLIMYFIFRDKSRTTRYKE